MAAFHGSTIIVLFGFAIFGLALMNVPLFSTLDLELSLMLAFALSFSSTVLFVKMLEEKGEMKSLEISSLLAFSIDRHVRTGLADRLGHRVDVGAVHLSQICPFLRSDDPVQASKGG